ncbi:MAG TPA: redoxin domain-containing protein [Pirellulales bacterium]|nr:redoxin domain-containing protein [Pirellulales bacterium]
MKRIVLPMFAVALATAAANVRAEKPRIAGDTGAPAVAHDPTLVVQLVRDPAVQQELDLEATEADAVDALVADVEYKLFLLRDVPATEKTIERNALAERVENGLRQTLRQPQRKRLSELLLRAQGYPALAAPPYAETLKLSRAQVDSITKLLNAAKQAKAGTPAANLDKQVLGVLNREQNEQLTHLAGEPFDLSQVQVVACKAPELRDVERWINAQPQSFASLKGRVVAMHFWAFGCVNCVRNLPHYNDWHARFARQGLTVLGIHTPETDAERSLDGLADQVKSRKISYPIAADGKGANWNAWANQVWPAVYLIDRRGYVRYWWYGELNWQGNNGEATARKRILELLAEEG